MTATTTTQALAVSDEAVSALGAPHYTERAGESHTAATGKSIIREMWRLRLDGERYAWLVRETNASNWQGEGIDIEWLLSDVARRPRLPRNTRYGDWREERADNLPAIAVRTPATQAGDRMTRLTLATHDLILS